ncbi:MAG: radical SAM protein [Acidobacteriota bacterium]
MNEQRLGPAAEIASAYKISYHSEKIAAYLKGDRIFPATLELDITSRCTRVCADCPSGRGGEGHNLSVGFVGKLLASLEGQTRGLLLTGGEPTMSPIFPDVLRLARERGFVDVAVVTNGSLLHQERVVEALVSYASTIRLSAYDWDGGVFEEMAPMLGKVEALRRRVDELGSALKIGVSALTSKDRAHVLPALAERVRSAGAHWIYFHPMCTGWGSNDLAQVNQAGVPETLAGYLSLLSRSNGFEAFVSKSRYSSSELKFHGYHAAHFMLVVGADGLNYLAPEVKYHPDHVIADLGNEPSENFLWESPRLEKIRPVSSMNYRALRSRHRGVLYNDLIERIRCDELSAEETGILEGPRKYRFPHIL